MAMRNKEWGNYEKITIIFMPVLMIFASCSMDIPYDDINKNTETVEESKEDDTKNNTDEPSNEEPKEDDTEIVEDEPSNEDGSENNEVVCEIDEDTKILGLNYFVCVDNSQTKLSPSINDESQAKKDTFLIRGYASKYIEIRVGYKNKKLNFSSVSDNYIITDVMKKDSTININIEWKWTITPLNWGVLFYFLLNKGHPAFIKDVS